MGKYGVFFDAYATSTTAKTAVEVYPNAAGERGEIIELIMTGSGSATAADTQHRARVAKCTFAGTGTGTIVTGSPFDEKSAAGNLQLITECSAEPTTVGTVYPLLWGFNQRGGMRWAVPKGEGFFVNNADTNVGAVFQVLSSGIGEVDGSVHIWEP